MTKIKENRTARLLALMDQNKLDAATVGSMLGRTAQTVRVWRCADESRAIPADALNLLELKLTALNAAAPKSSGQRGRA
jgi:hypothetical protein